MANITIKGIDEVDLESNALKLLSELLRERKGSQKSIGELVGLDQPKTSSIINQKLQHISIKRCVKCLMRLGCNVTITVDTTDTI